MTIPAILCVDVEPDPRVVPVPSEPRWIGFEGLLDDLDRFRKRLSEPTGRPAGIGWFLRMDPQVEVAHGDVGWAADRYAGALAELVDEGDELGLHAHSWRWHGGGWISDQSADWVAHCAAVSLDAYEAAFERPCRSYRHGDRFTSDALRHLLQGRGVRCDLGLEPGRPAVGGLEPSEASRGMLPAVPDDQVHPFVAVHGGSSDDALLVVPLTSSFDAGQEVARARFGTLLLWTPPRTFAALLDARLAAGDVRHLAFAVRSDVALGGRMQAWLEQNLDHVGRTLGPDLEWLTPSAARRRLLAPGHADLSPTGEVWPRSLSLEAVHEVCRRALDELRRVEVESADREDQRTEAGAARAELEVALHAAQAQVGSLAASGNDLRVELATLEGTATWRLHQRLLPALRVARRVLSPRGGSRGG